MKFKPLLYVIPLIFSFALLGAETRWQSLVEDGLHDPASPAIGVLQEPASALSLLPPDNTGNRVSWIRALREGYIEPRTNIYPETKIEILDMDIIMEKTGELSMVMFPHKPHTEWLDCANCHDRIFVKKVDANPINMFAILSGEYCCHCQGAVAFPLTECNRCHSVASSSFTGKPGVEPISVSD